MDSESQEPSQPKDANHSIKQDILSPLRPTRGWFFGGAGVLALVILDQLDAPLWMTIAAFLLLLSAAVLWPWIEQTKIRKTILWAVLGLYGTFCVVFLIVYPQHPPKKLYLSCEILPVPVPFTRPHNMELLSLPSGNPSRIQSGLPSGEHWQPDVSRSTIPRCVLRNDDTVTLVDISVLLEVIVRRAIFGDSTVSMGGLTSTHQVYIDAPRIESMGEFTFYVLSEKPDSFIVINPSNEASVRIVGEPKPLRAVVESGPMPVVISPELR